MGFNFIDFIVLFFFLYFLWQGYQIGFIGGVLNTFSTLISFAAAFLFYPQVGSFLASKFGWSENLAVVVAFFMILIIVEVMVSLIFNRLHFLLVPLYKTLQGFLTVDKILGIFPSVLVGLSLVSLFLLLPLILPVKETFREVVADSWWGKHVLVRALKYQPQIEAMLNRLPYKNLAYLITPQPLSSESVRLDFPKEIKLTADPTSEKAMFDLVNQERQKVGLEVLVWNEQLKAVGEAHCLDMFERGYFSHYTPEGASPFDRMDQAGIKYSAAGENLAYAPSVQVAHQGLMSSAGHRANILRPEFGHLGVGVIDGGINGKMLCQEFTD